jgi:hypothetical protein
MDKKKKLYVVHQTILHQKYYKIKDIAMKLIYGHSVLSCIIDILYIGIHNL